MSLRFEAWSISTPARVTSTNSQEGGPPLRSVSWIAGCFTGSWGSGVDQVPLGSQPRTSLMTTVPACSSHLHDLHVDPISPAPCHAESCSPLLTGACVTTTDGFHLLLNHHGKGHVNQLLFWRSMRPYQGSIVGGASRVVATFALRRGRNQHLFRLGTCGHEPVVVTNGESAQPLEQVEQAITMS